MFFYSLTRKRADECRERKDWLNKTLLRVNIRSLNHLFYSDIDFNDVFLNSENTALLLFGEKFYFLI